MRTVFETDLSTNTVWYLGYPSGDRHQTGNEMMEEKLGRESLVELVYVHEPADLITNAGQHTGIGFSHICISVPDVPAALARLKAHDVEFITDAGEAGTAESFATMLGLPPATIKGVKPAFLELFKGIAFAKDPDGYLAEIAPHKA